MDYQVKLDKFEGPLDLLLFLIKKQEINIYDIPIAHITKQYLEYIRMLEFLNLELAGEFLVMAATLMRIKARLLLPRQEELEEELRLMYVAATRAKENLFIIYPMAVYDRNFGMTLSRPCRFIDDLPEHILEKQYTGRGRGRSFYSDDFDF